MAKKKSSKYVVKKAQSQIGYLEKETNAYLNFKKLNAGDQNYTKYGAWYHMNAQPWCCIFLSWLFAKVYGYEEGKKMLYGQYQAACEYMRQQFVKAGKYHTAKGYTPKKGDVIFYWVGSAARADHIGLVEKVFSGYVGTIEGNTSSKAGVIDNGGAVERKTYTLGYYKIMGYGTPNYESEPLKAPDVVLKIGATGAAVKKLQRCLNKVMQYKLVVDGEYGPETSKAIKQFKVIYELDNKNGDIYGKKMRKALNRELRAMESKQD